MRRKQRELLLEGVNLLDLKPVRVARWEAVEDRIVVIRPSPAGGGLRGLVDRMLSAMSARRIRLDAVGSFAWASLDGTRTVRDVAQLLKKEFGEKVEPAEDRLATLVRVMRREGLLAYPGWDDVGPSNHGAKPV